jgi:hypothetical protein
MARRPIWLWPNLLSLDAPLVAVAWFWMFKQVWGVRYTQPTLPWFLALVVWCIYVADRLFDERMAALGSRRGTPRHEFHRRWRQPLTFALGIGIVVSIALLVLQGQGLFKHGLFVLVPVGGYFMMAFYDSGRGVSYLKNVLAGMAFAYGAAVGVHFHSGESGNLRNLLLAPEVISFAVLCILNMTAIDHWEESRRSKDSDEKAQYEALLTLMLILLASFALVLAVRAEHLSLLYQKAFFICIMVAAGALQVINRMRARFSLDALRVLADVAMLLPLPLFYVMVKYAES